MRNSVKMIREKLMVDGVKFMIEGHNDYRRKKEYDITLPEVPVGEYGYFPIIFEVNQFSGDNFSIHGGLRGMNVEKFGPTCVWLYSFNMLGIKNTGKIKYSDITFLEEN